VKTPINLMGSHSLNSWQSSLSPLRLFLRSFKGLAINSSEFGLQTLGSRRCTSTLPSATRRDLDDIAEWYATRIREEAKRMCRAGEREA
jgi:hypothetical protein